MQDNFPRLHSLSTVCLLKHYNQDYLLHSLRTDFTGSNGVGKSIIADLFQIIFVADQAHIKFGTDGIDAKGRKVEKLPYASNVGYAFFQVEVAARQFITIGAAIFARTHHVITPFLITATMDLQQSKPDMYAFGAEKLLFSKDFLTNDRTPFALDEMAINVLDNHGLYMHKFGTKDERIQFYDWLYNNGLLPVKLSNAGTLKSFAKVVQSFSKSKSLDVNSSKHLIQYLFDDDEATINKEYEEQENMIRRLLQDFKMARQQTDALVSKQKELLVLKQQEQEKQDKTFQWRQGAYVDAWQKLQAGKDRMEKAAFAVNTMENDQARRQEKGIKVKRLLLLAETAAKLAEKRLNALADNESLFDQLEALQKKEALLRAIDLQGLIKQSTDQVKLLEKDVDYYIQHIEDSRDVLTRYHTVEHMTRTKEEQDEWLYKKTVAVREAINDLKMFQQSLAKVEQHDLFTNAFKTRKKLNKAEQAVLFHLRGVLLSKPHQPQPGARYTDSEDLLQELSITRDTEQNGWWIQTGPLFEFVPAASLHLPDIESMEFNSIEEVKQYLHQRMEGLEKQKKVYEDLGKGIKAEGFTEYAFDIDLSDNTRLKMHTEAAWLCNIVDMKIFKLLEEQAATRSKIKVAKEDAEITDDNFDYDALFLKFKTRHTICQKRFGNLKNYDAEIRIRLEGIAVALPELRNSLVYEKDRLDGAESHFNKCKERFEMTYPEYPLPITESHMLETYDLVVLQQAAETASTNYGANYISISGHYEETRNRVNVLVNDQLDQITYSFVILERALLGNKIATLDDVAGHLHELNVQLLRIIEELVKSLSNVFRKTEECYDNYKGYIDSLNRFFHERLISGRFYFTIDFEVNPALDIGWIEHMRRSFDKSAAEQVHEDLDPGRFIEEFYMKYAKSKKATPLHDLLNPKKYFILRVKLTDENNKTIPGSTGESYTAIALLGIARLSIVQDGNRPGLRFIILEESATLDNVNFNMFPLIAKQYGYQIVTMTPKPYSIGGEEGWYIHNLLGGKENKDINYPEVFSFFRTPRENIKLDMYLSGKRNELADL